MIHQQIPDPGGAGGFPATPEAPLYRLTTYSGATLQAPGDHLWEVEWANQFNRTRWKKTQLTTVHIKELVDNGRHVRMPEAQPKDFGPASSLPVDPYLLGLLLAEGSLDAEGVSFASDDPEIVQRIRDGLPPKHSLVSRGVKHRISIGLLGRANKNANLILAGVRDLGLVGHRAWEKFIPDAYKYASVEDRAELLRGYLDGDGSIKQDGNVRVSTASRTLALDVQGLVRSLGGDCRIVHVTGKTYKHRGEIREARDEYRINGITIRVKPFWLPRKAGRYQFSQATANRFRRVISVERA